MLAPRPLASLSAVVVMVALFATCLPASGSNWVLSLAAGSKGESKATAAPAAPSGVSAACVSSSLKEVTVSWNAVTDATTYTILKSTTSATGTFSSTATGVTTTTWTTTLTASNDWFKVEAYVGTHWVGAQSTATGETTISASGCIQP